MLSIVFFVCVCVFLKKKITKYNSSNITVALLHVEIATLFV